MIGRHVFLASRGIETEGHRLKKGTIPRALRLAMKYRFQLGLFLGLTVAGALLANAPPLLLRALVAEFDPPPGDRSTIITLAALALAVAIFDVSNSVATSYVSSRIGEGLIYDLRVALFDHVQRQPIGFFTRTQTGSLISRLNNDVIGAHSAFTRTLGGVLANIVSVTTTLVIMLALDWRLTLVSLAIAPGFAIPAKRGGRRLAFLVRERMDVNADMNTTMQERFNVAGALLAKLFGSPREESQRFAERADRVGAAGVKISLRASILGSTLSFVSAIGVAVAFLVGGNLVVSGTIHIADLVAFLALLRLLYSPLAQLASARADLMSSFVSFERVFEVLDLAPAIADRADARTFERVSGRIEFVDVRLRYPGADEVSLASLEHTAAVTGDEGAEVLRGVSFVVEPGTTAALVGPSGAGKSTIMNLIPRLYDVTGGSVRVDGTDVREISQDSLRAHIGVVTQDAHLFHDTVGANLRYARPDATDDEVWAACEAAEIATLIRSLPVGLDTVVGERGYRLSGGEKQRLAIARVLLKAPAIVLLDEATAHLDSESEALIQRALARALAGRTAVVIAHRLSTIVHADQILVVEAGQIVERGRHADLATAGGVYASLYATQFARAVTE